MRCSATSTSTARSRRTTEFTAEFQDLITRYAWGEIWSRPGLDRKTRSCITLTALVALGRENELAMHVRAALRNGLDAGRDQGGAAPVRRLLRRPGGERRLRDREHGARGGGPVSRAVVISAVRTPVGRYGGALAGVRPDDLAAIAIAAAVERAGVDPAARSRTSTSAARTRRARTTATSRGWPSLLAGLPDSVAGVTVNRLCASGLSAVVAACHAVVAGDGDLFVAGGVESMTRAPLVTAKPDKAFPRGDRMLYDTTLGWRFPNPRLEELFPLETMGETGENVAERWGVTREDQDAFALRIAASLGGG